MSENTRIIEISGQKFEVDTREAVRIDNVKVGDKVKVLTKEYGDKYKVHHGIIVGFDAFPSHPTIVIAYVEIGYRQANVKFLYFNDSTQDIEIVKALDQDEYAIDKEEFNTQIQTEIDTKKQEIVDLEERRDYFNKTFHTFWEPVKTDSK